VKFNFKAVNKTGEIYEDSRESASKFTLYAELKAEGITLIVAHPADQKKSFLSGDIPMPFGGISEHDKITFTKNLGYMIAAELPLARCLSVLEKQVANKKLKDIIASLQTEIRQGKTLSESAKMYPKVFSNLFVSMVKAGEESGKLSESLAIIAMQMDSVYKLKSKIRGAMIYPCIIVSLMAIIGILMLIYVVPSITATFSSMGVQLPFLTRVLIDTSSLLTKNIFLTLLFLVLIIVVGYLITFLDITKRFFQFSILHMPLIGELVKETNSARITRTISSLLSSGVPFDQAISITSDVIQNRYFKKILHEAMIKVQKGESISSVFLAHTDLCPVFVGEMMSVGEETGQLPSMLIEVAKFYETSVDQATSDMSSIIEPFLMIIIGIVVGLFALAIIKPIYSVMDNIS
jgi:type IV pilus assembly protein PilC